MAKKSSNKFGPQQMPAAATATGGVPRPSLEKQIPVWSASFESASKVYRSFGMSLDIQVEPDWLRSVCERFRGDGDTDLARWIEQFANVCVTGQQTHLSDPTAKGDGVHLFKWTPLLAF
ncbi:TPA: hypothetical protein ACXJPD_005693 [Pseudomonas aeruginosa]